MKIFVLNSGSSSIKSQLFEKEKVIFKGVVDGIGTGNSNVKISVGDDKNEENLAISNHKMAINTIMKKLLDLEIIGDYSEIEGVGHRVVHGGELFKDSIVIDNSSLKKLEEISDLAPLHNPSNIEGIKICMSIFRDVPQVAVFDTSFHSTLDISKYLYAIPFELYDGHKVRKYGFHGTSFKYLTYQMSKKYPGAKKLILCHLGNGSSICAVDSGKSVNTSMGFTPLSGVVMGTRSGDIDPSLVKVISELKDLTLGETINLLNKESGLKGISGNSDMRDILNNLKKDFGSNLNKSKVAFDILVESIVKYISYFITNLGGVDAIVFSAGLGENSSLLRERIIEKFSYLGLKINIEANAENEELISDESSSGLILKIPTNEELMIAEDVFRLIAS